LLRIVPTGCGSLDEQLKGGFLEGSMALVYGEAETGKTTLAIQCAVNCAIMGYKTIFVDCDGTFFGARMEHVAGNDFDDLGPRIILMKPEDFERQTFIIDRLDDYISKTIGLIVVDTITGLYREKFGDGVEKTFILNRELNRQMASLAEITKTRKVVSLITSQVRSVFYGQQNELVQPVATRVLKFWADTVISLRPTARANVIRATVERNKDKKPAKPVFLKIQKNGLHGGKR
jgi:RecA/RadA recombinase